VVPVRDRLVMTGRWLDAALSRDPDRSVFDGVRRFCLFVGYPRSGHSLVGSLLDAHPQIVISHELDALRYVQTGVVGRDVLFRMILRRDRRFTQAGRRWTGYDYAVPGQSQGRFDELQVIGDKRGGGSTRRLGAHPDLLDRLRRVVGVDVRIVHVVRDPFDTIASMHRRGGRTLEESIDRFFALCAINDRIRSRARETLIDVRLEQLVADPSGTLGRLVGFLGLEASPEYLRACSEVVFDAPRRSRASIEWPDRAAADVRDRMVAYDFLGPDDDLA
jgi:hypothetical protein